MALVNPMNAFAQTYGALEGMRQDRVSRQAGNALAQGDLQGGASALLSGGMIREGMGVQRHAAEQQAMSEERERELAEQRTAFLVRGIHVLQQIPEQERAQAFSRLAPELESLGMPPDVIQRLASSPMDDRSLQAFQGVLVDQAAELRLFNTRDGIVGVRGNEANLLYEARPDDRITMTPWGPMGPPDAIAALQRAIGGGGGAQAGGDDEWEYLPPANPSQPARGQRERDQPVGVSFRDSNEARAAISRVVPGVRFTSGPRSRADNQRVRGAPGSFHLQARAWDLVPPQGMSMAQLADTMRRQGFRVLNEGDHVHVSW